MKNVYTGIDIGTDSIKVVVCQLFNNKLNLLAASSVKSKGIKDGSVVNDELAISSVKQAIEEVEEMLGIEIKKVITSIPSKNAQFLIATGKVEIDEEIGVLGKDVARVLENSLKSIEIGNNEIVNIVPINFGIDDQKNLIDPRGKTGKILTSRAVVSIVPKNDMYSIINILEKVGLEVVDVSINQVGDINTFKNKETSNQVGAIINIGYEQTSITLYNKDIAIKSKTINLGGKNIDNDIAYMYKLNISDAIKIKEKFALAHKRYASKSEFIETTNKLDEKIKINQFELSEVIMSRIEEILQKSKYELNFLTNRDVDYIIVSGGTSSMDNFSVVTEEVLGNIAKVGTVKVLGIRNNKYSSVVGNIIYFINKMKLRSIDYSMVDDYEYEEEHKIINNTMLGKVFGYFFE